jgi:hypothetical protein
MFSSKALFLFCVILSYSCHSNSPSKGEVNKVKGMSKSIDYFELTYQGKIYKIPVLSTKEVQDFLKSSNIVKLKKPIYSELSLNVYKADLGVLAIRDGQSDAPLYPSEEVLVYQLKGHSFQPRPILEGINIYGENFPKFSYMLADSFLKKMGISENDLPLNILTAVDERLLANRTKKFFNEEVMSIIALIGELINKKYHSEWIMVKSDSTWTPAILYKGQKIFFENYILLDFDNKEEKSPIQNSYLTICDIIESNL